MKCTQSKCNGNVSIPPTTAGKGNWWPVGVFAGMSVVLTGCLMARAEVGSPVAAANVVVGGMTGSERNATETAAYQVTFVPSWNPATHPFEYPTSHAKQGLLTPMIGATHGEDYQLFALGDKPTPGLERLSEMGMRDQIAAEINAAIASGKATSVIEFADGSPGPVHPPVSAKFVVDRQQPIVSLAGMIAPSPDWFYGVSNVNLFRDGAWIPCVTVEAYACDSGGDAGRSYLAADEDLNPKEATTRAQGQPFSQRGAQVPVGVYVFKRIPSMGK